MLKKYTTFFLATLFSTMLFAEPANGESAKTLKKGVIEMRETQNTAGELQTGYAPVPLSKSQDASNATPAIVESASPAAPTTPVEPENRTIISSSTKIEGCNNGLIIVGSKFSCSGAEEKSAEATKE